MARPPSCTTTLLHRTRVGSASLPQKRASNSRWKMLIFWLGKVARPYFLRRTRQARYPYSNSMTVHTCPSLLRSAGTLRGFSPNPTS